MGILPHILSYSLKTFKLVLAAFLVLSDIELTCASSTYRIILRIILFIVIIITDIIIYYKFNINVIDYYVNNNFF